MDSSCSQPAVNKARHYILTVKLICILLHFKSTLPKLKDAHWLLSHQQPKVRAADQYSSFHIDRRTDDWRAPEKWSQKAFGLLWRSQPIWIHLRYRWFTVHPPTLEVLSTIHEHIQRQRSESNMMKQYGRFVRGTISSRYETNLSLRLAGTEPTVRHEHAAPPTSITVIYDKH